MFQDGLGQNTLSWQDRLYDFFQPTTPLPAVWPRGVRQGEMFEHNSFADIR